MICRYPGPVKLIRRTKDEMITTIDPPQAGALRANRGNYLLVELLQFRFAFETLINRRFVCYKPTVKLNNNPVRI